MNQIMTETVKPESSSRHKSLIIIVILCLAIIFPKASYSQLEISTQNQTVNVDGLMYVHPDKKFSVFVPKEAQIIDTQGTMDLALKSLKGWSVNIQSSPANPSISLGQMAGHFESKYVGPEKPWPHKLAGETVDTNTYSGRYEGSGTTVQVTIRRTPSWDYALIFIAPVDSFLSSLDIFNYMLQTFQPLTTAGDNVVNQSASLDGYQSESSSQPQNGNAYKRFSDATFGYELIYPSYWEVKSPDKYSIVFSGPSGTDERYIAVSIRNVAIVNPATPKSVAEGMLQQIQTQMAYMDSDVRHDQSVEVDIGQGDYRSRGLQMTSSFRRSHIDYRRWSIAVTRPEGGIVYVWTYTAPVDRFQKYQSIAEKMAGSFAFLNPTAQ